MYPPHLLCYKHHGDSVRVKWAIANQVSIQGLSYKVIKPRWGIVLSEPGEALRIGMLLFGLELKLSSRLRRCAYLICQFPHMVLWRVRITMLACWTQTPVDWLWAKQPQPEWTAESRTENPGMSWLSDRESQPCTSERDQPRASCLWPLTTHLPLLTLWVSLTEAQKEEPGLRTAPGKAMFLWQWAADDVTLWYLVTQFLANLCIKLV